MKFFVLLVIASSLSSCILTFDADGSKSVVLDGKSLIEILAKK